MTQAASEPIEASSEDTHTSVILQRLIQQAPADHFTLGWMIDHLPNRSYGIILLFLSLISLLPIISIPARILIIILLSQIILGYRAPVLPDRLMKRSLPSRYLMQLECHAIPLLRHLEMLVRPRWGILLTVSRRVVAFLMILLMSFSLIAPLPLANMPPAIIGVLTALAYIEHDGVMLTIAFSGLAILSTALFFAV